MTETQQPLRAQELSIPTAVINFLRQPRKTFGLRDVSTLWPTEASARGKNEFGEDKIFGKCARATIYRLMGLDQTEPPGPRSQLIFSFGKQYENHINNLFGEMGILQGRSTKFMKSELLEEGSNEKIIISGEIDTILENPYIQGSMFAIEQKTFYGYYANKMVLGHSQGRSPNKVWHYGKPKTEALMQAALQAWYFVPERLEAVKLLYSSRDNNEMICYNVLVDNDEKSKTFGALAYQQDEVAEATNEAPIFKVDEFKMQDIFDRYREVWIKYKNGLIPDKDYEHRYSEEKTVLMHSRGEISDSKFKARRRDPCGDWQCSYCPWLTICSSAYSDDPEQVKEKHLK